MGGWSGKRGEGQAIKWIMTHINYNAVSCLRWPFSYDLRVGRGRCGWNGKQYWAHRLMCELAHGPAPADKPQAAHSCGNGHMGCVNPRHLSWATNRENSQDKIIHGTTRKSGGKKLPADAVAKIKSLAGKKTQVALAAEFGVSLSCIQYHQRGKEHWPSHNRNNR